jgi:heme/copper-type cytochrome/quinol oxidase subunit 1
MGENHAAEQANTPKPARAFAAILPFAGFAAVLVGGLVAYLNRDYAGWFAYAPLSNRPFTANNAALITQGTQLGLAIAVVGLLLLTFWAGYRTGTRATPGSSPND